MKNNGVISEWFKKWLPLISLFLTIFFHLKGELSMKDLIGFWDSINPWKTLAFILFIIFLVSSFVWIKDKFIRFKNNILTILKEERNRDEITNKVNIYQNAVISLGNQLINIDNRLDRIEEFLKTKAELTQ